MFAFLIEVLRKGLQEKREDEKGIPTVSAVYLSTW